MRQHFCIRLRNKLIPFPLQLLAQFHIVLNNPIVHHHNGAVFIIVGMGVHICRRPVSRPAGVPNTRNPRKSTASVSHFLQNFQLTHGLYHINLCPIINCHSRRIISPVFQLGKTVQQNRRRLLLTNISYNTTHPLILPLYVVNFCNYKTLLLVTTSRVWQKKQIRSEFKTVLSSVLSLLPDLYVKK